MKCDSIQFFSSWFDSTQLSQMNFKAAVRNFFWLKMISEINIWASTQFKHGTTSLRHTCKHKEVFPASRLSHVRILQVPAHL